MFTKVRRRLHLTPSTVIASLALVFAMTGGAYAASKVLITSTKQISPKVLKSLKGANGKNGTNGTNGAPGATGATGPAGAGTPGATGPQGPQGPAGANGTNGTNGTDGTTGFTDTLPSGKTETGAWTYSLVLGEAEVAQQVSLSFTIPLAEELGGTAVHYILVNGKEWDFATEAEVTTTACLGTVAEPKAAPGNLCVYASPLVALEGFQVAPPERIGSPSLPIEPHTLSAGRTGALLAFATAKEKLGYGTWAVTAE